MESFYCFFLYFTSLSDIIIMNSCLWDVNRRGPTFKEIYEEKLNKLVDSMKNKFPRTQLYWMTTPPSNFDFNKRFIYLLSPVSWKTDSRGMKLPGLHFQNVSTCFNVIEANHLCGKNVMKSILKLLPDYFQEK